MVQNCYNASVPGAPKTFKVPFCDDPAEESDGTKSAPLDSSAIATTTATQLFSALWRSDRIHQLGTLDQRSRKFKNLHVKDVTEAVRRALALSDSGAEAYFAIAEYKNSLSRCADNAFGAWAFWVDIDCGEGKAASGKGYATVEEAQQAVAKFCKEAGLSEPTHIVSSGGGLHVYWALDKIVEREVWQAYAAKLKALTKALKFLADDTRTADIASVLRVPGTMNYKYEPPRPVTLLHASNINIPQVLVFAAIDLAHGRLCPAAAEKEASPANVNGTANAHAEQSESWVPDIPRLSSALATLTPDCDDGTWKLKRIAPLARAAYQFPEHTVALKELARSWSSGKLSGIPSKAWVTPGSTNGLIGEQVFDSVWERFYNDNDSGKRTSLGTIYHEARETGWTYVAKSSAHDADEFELCETTVVHRGQRLPIVTTPATKNTAEQSTFSEGFFDEPSEIWTLNEQFAFIEENSSISAYPVVTLFRRNS